MTITIIDEDGREACHMCWEFFDDYHKIEFPWGYINFCDKCFNKWRDRIDLAVGLNNTKDSNEYN